MKQKDIAFLGKITAGITHEMKNVLATMNESSGLMGDVLASTQHEPFPGREIFTRAIASLHKQIQRGVRMMSDLNTFAHKMDHEDATADVTDIIELAVFLTSRSARQKQVQLSVDPLMKKSAIHTKPFRLILALAACIDYLLQILPPQSTLTLNTEYTAEYTVFLMSGESESATQASPPPAESPLPDLEEFCQLTSAVLTPLQVSGKKGVQLSLPHR